MASATRRSHGGHANKTGEGVGYEDGAPRGDGEATAFAAMPARVTMAARRTGDVEAAAVALTTTPRRMMVLPRDDESNDDTHQGARRRPPRATKAARCTGDDEAAFASAMNDAKDDDIAPRDEDSDKGANDDADDDAEKGAKPRAAGKADEYGARHVRATTTPHDSDDNSYDSADKVAKPRATDKADEATRDCGRRVRVAVARNSVMATRPRRRCGDVTAR